MNLLQDDDPKIAALAMEEFLKLDNLTEQAIAECQESHDPKLRLRIHQISSILQRRRARKIFIESMDAEKLSLWEGVVQINCLYDPRCNPESINEEVEAMADDLRSGTSFTTPQLATFMRDREISVPEEGVLDVDFYLIERILENNCGSAAVLTALAHQVATLCKWPMTVVLHGGAFCLIDRNNLLLDPSQGWHISKLKAADKIHPCGRRDVLLGMLSQLLLVTLLEGNMRDLHHFGSLMSALNRTRVEDMPFPLGEAL